MVFVCTILHLIMVQNWKSQTMKKTMFDGYNSASRCCMMINFVTNFPLFLVKILYLMKYLHVFSIQMSISSLFSGTWSYNWVNRWSILAVNSPLSLFLSSSNVVYCRMNGQLAKHTSNMKLVFILRILIYSFTDILNDIHTTKLLILD